MIILYMYEYVMALCLIALFYWYFNILNNNRCLTVYRDCDNVDCKNL
jgi:hypothetical protein